VAKGAKVISYPGAAHITGWDAREDNVRDVRQFARDVDRER
jgi:hypothetical protein